MTQVIMEGLRPPLHAEDLAEGMGVMHHGVWREIATTASDADRVYVSFVPDADHLEHGDTYTVGTPVWAFPAWTILADRALAEAAGPGADGEQVHDA